MEKFDNFSIAIALDGSTMDEVLVDYLKVFLPFYSTKKIIGFTLVPKDSANPQVSEAEFKTFMTDSFEDFPSIRVSYRILRSSKPIAEVEKLVNKEDIQTLVVGRKHISIGSGNLAKRFSRRLLCNVLTVTPEPSLPIKKVLVPIDFTRQSNLSLDWVVTAHNYFKFEEIICVNIFNLPSGYTAAGKTRQDFKNIMLKNAESNYQNFIAKYKDSGIKFKRELHLDLEDYQKHEIIFKLALVHKVDLIVIATKGRTTMAAVLLSSTTEKLLYENVIMPTFVLKTGNKNMSFIQALSEI